LHKGTLVSSQSLEELIAKLGVSPTSTSELVGRNILSARVAAGKSLQEVAVDAGIQVEDLKSIETAKRRPSGSELVKIAEALDVLVDRFFIGI
jgi:ribosome-binding protein aMBF1 (putative translation factor)